MSGLFAVNKPSGISSAGLLNDLQHILKRSPLFEPEIKAQQSRSNTGRKGRKQKMGNKIKMGHGGTLDPLASGVLVVGTGRGTKDLGKFLSCSKDYEAIALFGCSTDTYDSEGKVVCRRPWKHITPQLLEDRIVQFRGDIMQTPPIYSALKMQGKPLYEYAREGKPLPAEIKARPANVSRFEITKFSTDHEWTFPKETASEEVILSAEALEQLQVRPNVNSAAPAPQEVPLPVKLTEPQTNTEEDLPSSQVAATDGQENTVLGSINPTAAASDESGPPAKRARVASPSNENKEKELGSSETPLALHISMTVSSGTYVRSLIHDLGIALGSAAHMVALVRKRVGEFTLDESVPWESFEAGTWQESLSKRLDFGSAEVSSHVETEEQAVLQAQANASERLRIDGLSDPLERQVGMFLLPSRPFRRTLTYAQSLDGKVSGPASKPLTISCPESFRVTHELRRLHDVILVGVGTAIGDDPGLNARDGTGKPYPLEEQPVPVIVDPHGRLSLSQDSKLMRNFRKKIGRQPVQIVHESRRGSLVSASNIIYIDSNISVEPDEIRFLWKDIFDALQFLGHSVMIEGGATVIAEVLRENAADQVIVTVAPTYVGEGVGIHVKHPVGLTAVRTECFGRDSVVVGRLRTPRQGSSRS